MGGLRTSFAALLGLMLSAPPAPADPLLREFAVCTGRMTAAVEHDWLLMQDARPAIAARDGLAALVAALALPDDSAQVGLWRATARIATRALLERGTFANDQVARQRAADLIRACQALVLTGS